MCLSMVISAAASLVLLVPPTSATAWLDAAHVDMTTRSLSPDNSRPLENFSQLPGCQHTLIQVSDRPEQQAACVAEAQSFRLAFQPSRAVPLIQLGSDAVYYPLIGLTNTAYFGRLLITPASDDLSAVRWSTIAPASLELWHNFPSKLTLTQEPAGFTYRLASPASYTLSNPSGSPYTVGQVDIARSGRYLALQINGYGLARLDTTTHQLRIFSTRYLGQHSGAEYLFAIADDGSTVVATGRNTGLAIYDLTAACGSDTITTISRLNECQPITLTSQIATAAGYTNAQLPYNYWISAAIFTDSHKSEVNLQGSDGDIKYITITPTGYITPIPTDPTNPPTTPADNQVHYLDYLALGDSYSSGEGDVGRRSDGSPYYLAGTEGQGSCHVSSRSYPYLLRDKRGVSGDRMKSVACSGAQVVADFIAPKHNYLGQTRQLEGRSEAERTEIRDNALKDYTPGVVPQLEFVREYEPKVITLTGGGNDVGFARIIQYCASPHWDNFVRWIDNDCGYANPGSELEKLLNDSIDTQYTYSKLLIRKLKEASPGTRIIIVGYPSFLNSMMPTCSLVFNSGMLSQNERIMINNAVSRMNNMLEKAAHDMSVSFVDIEDSLQGGRMCEGSRYVTGIAAAGYYDVIHDKKYQEIFHPNAAGHQQIAESIEQSGVFVEDNIPGSSSYRPAGDTKISVPEVIVQGGWFVAGSVIRTAFNPLSFAPASPVYATGFSDRVDLGTYITDASGGLKATIDTSKLPVGSHVIVLEGTSYSGEPIRYYQFVDVVSSDTAAEGDAQHIHADQSIPRSVAIQPPVLAIGSLRNFPSQQSLLAYNDKVKISTDNKISGLDIVDTSGLRGSHEHASITSSGSIASTKLAVIAGVGLLLIGGVIYAIKRSKR